jgi:hypothetical protein
MVHSFGNAVVTVDLCAGSGCASNLEELGFVVDVARTIPVNEVRCGALGGISTNIDLAISQGDPGQGSGRDSGFFLEACSAKDFRARVRRVLYLVFGHVSSFALCERESDSASGHIRSISSRLTRWYCRVRSVFFNSVELRKSRRRRRSFYENVCFNG